MALSKFCAVVWMWFWNEAENKFRVKHRFMILLNAIFTNQRRFTIFKGR